MPRARPCLATALALLLAAPPARPCAPAPPPGRQVDVLSEEALIVWDAEKRVEHFVRRASFSSDAPDFGFLVPTPTRPELAEAPEALFGALERARAPEVIRRERTAFVPVLLVALPFLMFSRGAPPLTAGRPPVEVLEEKRVAGYDAAVLASTDASALSAWLAEHGYAQRPDLTDWLRPYVEAGHVLTAFKIAGGGTRRVGTAPVRMSFTTERPFFPYREPADQRRVEPGLERRLTLHLVAPERLQGRIGEGLPWKASVLYASPRADLPALLAGALPKEALPASGWLTTVVDSATPRPGTDDLFFSPAAQQQRVVPDPIVVDVGSRIPVPVDLLAAMAGFAFWLRRRRRRG